MWQIIWNHHHIVLGLYLLKFETCGAAFNHGSCVYIHMNPVQIPLQEVLFCQWPCGCYEGVVVPTAICFTSTITHLPFMATLSIIVSSLVWLHFWFYVVPLDGQPLVFCFFLILQVHYIS